MDASSEPILNHFAIFRFTDDYWRADANDRKNVQCGLLAGLRGAADVAHVYQVYPTEPGSDFLVWSALRTGDTAVPATFFEKFTRATSGARPFIEPRSVQWGFTRPSQYSKARSKQEIDPFHDGRPPYLIIYPFSKTAEWYMMASEARQGMMNEHIRIGKQYQDITQLLLYSFGLQDQEFNVVYETDDLTLFSRLVHELRTTEARRFTANDTPIHTALYCTSDDPLAVWR